MTNAITHGRSGGEVHLRVMAGVIRIEVHDQSSEEPVERKPTVHGSGGRGLPIVTSLVRQWGVQKVAAGKIVWAEIEIRDR